MTVYALAHQKGGAGKTTSAVHIAGELKPDVIIDLDVHQSISIINKFRAPESRWNIKTVADKSELISLLKTLNDEGKSVLIDCGGFDADINRVAMIIADIVIAPANDSITEQIGLSKFDNILSQISEKAGFPVKAHVFLCKSEPNKKHFSNFDGVMQHSKNLVRLESRLSYRLGNLGFLKSLERGLGITEVRHGRTSPAGKEVISLIAEINNLVNAEK